MTSLQLAIITIAISLLAFGIVFHASPLLVFYFIGSLFLLGIAILVYPTLRDQSKKK